MKYYPGGLTDERALDGITSLNRHDMVNPVSLISIVRTSERITSTDNPVVPAGFQQLARRRAPVRWASIAPIPAIPDL
jgi:hypothetical protein